MVASFAFWWNDLMFVPLILPSMLKAIGWVFLLEPNNGILNNVTQWMGLGKIFNA